MKYLFTGIAAIATLAFSAAVGAQPTNPSGGNAVGLPGPNPGGPGLTPYSTGASPAPTPSGQMPAGGRRTSGERIPAIMPDTSSPPPSASNTTSATPPTHRHARASSHGKMASHHPSRFPNLQGNSVANQLNQAELARVQSGNFTATPAPEMSSGAAPAPGMSANPNQTNRMSTGGRATSGGQR